MLQSCCPISIAETAPACIQNTAMECAKVSHALNAHRKRITKSPVGHSKSNSVESGGIGNVNTVESGGIGKLNSVESGGTGKLRKEGRPVDRGQRDCSIASSARHVLPKLSMTGAPLD